jgi:hypothetical protein
MLRDDLAGPVIPVQRSTPASRRHSWTQVLVADTEWVRPDLPLFAPDTSIATCVGDVDLDLDSSMLGSQVPPVAVVTEPEVALSPRRHAAWLANLGFDPSTDVDLLPALPPLPSRTTIQADSNLSAILPTAPVQALSGLGSSATASDLWTVSPPRSRPPRPFSASSSCSISDEENASPTGGAPDELERI